MKKTVEEMFGPVAAKYATSGVHNNDADLNLLVRIANCGPDDVLLDIATGAGNVALQFAPYCRSVVAFDRTPQMLHEVERRARERHFAHVSTMEGVAEDLPFADETFTIVTIRLAAHHFQNVTASLSEAFRVLRPGGRIMIEDTIAPEDDHLDELLNHIEALRDPSHHRNYKASEWLHMLSEAGFDILPITEDVPIALMPMSYGEWVERINTPAENRSELFKIFSDAEPGLRELLRIEANATRTDFTFCLPRGIYVGIVPAT